MTKQDHAISKMTAVWLLPVVTLIVASSSGGLLANALRPHSHTIALLTAGFSFSMVIIGLSFAIMMITVYLMRLVLYGPPDPSLILSAFITLGPLGQGGFSLLVNGQDLSVLIPLHVKDNFPQSELAGQMIYAACFCGAYVLWSMGIAWIIVACFSIANIAWDTKLPFSMAYWGLIFPNGVFALLSVQLAKVLDSPFFRAFGAAWSCKFSSQDFDIVKLTSFPSGIVFTLWLVVFTRSIPSFIDGSMFKAPYVPDLGLPLPGSTASDLEKHNGQHDPSGGHLPGSSTPSTIAAADPKLITAS